MITKTKNPLKKSSINQRAAGKSKKTFSAFNTDIGFYKKKNTRAGNLEIKNRKIGNLIEDVEVIEIEHHSDN